MAASKPYAPPVDQLLSYGTGFEYEFGHDYSHLGFTQEHVPELIRMATDMDLNTLDMFEEKNKLKVWGPLHAWRILGQLKATEAAEPLLELWNKLDDFDWTEELEDIFAEWGSVVLPVLRKQLANENLEDIFARIHAATTLAKMPKHHPETRAECVQLLTDQLAQHHKQAATLNAFLISSLVDLNAIEAAPVIEEAYRAKAVDPSIQGNWGDVEVRLGLKQQVEKYDFDEPIVTLPEMQKFLSLMEPISAREAQGEQYRISERKAAKKAKNKRKMAKASQKKNRRRK